MRLNKNRIRKMLHEQMNKRSYLSDDATEEIENIAINFVHKELGLSVEEIQILRNMPGFYDASLNARDKIADAAREYFDLCRQRLHH